MSLQSCYLIPTVDKPTQVRNTSATLIDNIFVNTPEMVLVGGNIISLTVAHRGHRFNKEKTLQIKLIVANIKKTSKKSTPAHCKQKGNCKKKYAHCKQKKFTLQTKLPHTANKKEPNCKKSARYKQKNYTLQTKLPHAAIKKVIVKKFAHCKQKNYTLQTKLQNFRTLQTKAKVLRAQDDVKDWDRVSWFSSGSRLTWRSF